MNRIKDLYKSFVSDVVENMTSFSKNWDYLSFKSASYPTSNQNLNRYFNKSGISFDVVNYLDPSYLAGSIWEHMDKHNSARKIYDYIIENDLAPYMKVSFEDDLRRKPSITYNFIAGFIGRMFVHNGYRLNFSEISFDKTFTELEDFFLNETITYTLLVNLYGPLGDIDIITLDDLCIKKADCEMSKLFCFHYSNSDKYSYEMLENDYYLEIEQKGLKRNWRELFQNDSEVIHKKFNYLILSNIGNIELGKVVRVSNCWPLVETKAMYRSAYIYNKYNEKNIYRFEINETFKRFIEQNYEKLKAIDFDNLDEHIKASLKRIKKSKATIDIEDKIIELVLSIEYLINTATYEVTFQLCLKMIKIYDETNQDETLFKLLKDFFNLRGDIFHGNKKVALLSKNIETIKKVEEIALRILVRFIILNQKYSFEEINNALLKSLYLEKTIDQLLEK